MKDLPSSIKVEDDTCIMEVDKEPASLVTEDTQDPMKDKSAGGNKGGVCGCDSCTCRIMCTRDYYTCTVHVGIDVHVYMYLRGNIQYSWLRHKHVTILYI